MTALLCAPISFTASTSGSFPQSNANVDTPGLIARGTSIACTFSSQSIDTIAIIGNQTGTVALSGGVTASASAFSGTKPSGVTTKTIFTFAPVTTTNVTITFAQSSDIQRVIIGKSVQTIGIDTEAEQSFDDQSVFNTGPGYVGVDPYQILPTWKFRMSWISDTQWRSELFPFFLNVGMSKGYLFVPYMEDSTRWQSEACFGRMTSIAKGTHSNYDNWVCELTMRSITA